LELDWLNQSSFFTPEPFAALLVRVAGVNADAGQQLAADRA